MKKILMSACLLGNPVRYNGLSLLVDNNIINKWQSEGRLISHCPEIAAGFPVPRKSAEILSNSGEQVLNGEAVVMDIDGADITGKFIDGAHSMLALCKKHNISLAILAEASPSCGSSKIYDGSFSGRKVKGMGVTTALLRRNGISVFSQYEINEAERFLLRIK